MSRKIPFTLLSLLLAVSAAHAKKTPRYEQTHQLTPEQAQQVPPEAVHDLAQKAERNNPSILETAGNFYSQHPTLVKSLGTVALASVLSHMTQGQR